MLDIFNKPVNFNVHEIIPRVYHLEFETQLDMTSTLLRFQEYFESPKFRKKIFTMKEYINWYSGEHNGIFSYFDDWNGFNFPSNTLKPFYDKKFKGITKREKSILNYFKSKRGKFYIIGTHLEDGGVESLSHEISHAIYYINSEYKNNVNSILSKIDLTELNNEISNIGYHKSVWLDEIHAYLTTGGLFENIKMYKYRKIIKELKNNFKTTISKVR